MRGREVDFHQWPVQSHSGTGGGGRIVLVGDAPPCAFDDGGEYAARAVHSHARGQARGRGKRDRIRAGRAGGASHMGVVPPRPHDEGGHSTWVRNLEEATARGVAAVQRSGVASRRHVRRRPHPRRGGRERLGRARPRRVRGGWPRKECGEKDQLAFPDRAVAHRASRDDARRAG